MLPIKSKKENMNHFYYDSMHHAYHKLVNFYNYVIKTNLVWSLKFHFGENEVTCNCYFPDKLLNVYSF